MAHREALDAQDQRMIDAAAHAPSLLVWSTEGPDYMPEISSVGQQPMSVKKNYIASMRRDPVSRLVGEWDLPSVSLPVEAGRMVRSGSSTFASLLKHHVTGDLLSPLWIPEFYLPPGMNEVPVAWIAETLELVLGEGAVGAVLPGLPSLALHQEWQDTLKELTTRLGVAPLQGEGRRAQSRVLVQDLEPGQLAWLTLESGARTGAVANADGTAELFAWHRGVAQVEVDGQQREVALSPGTWRDFTWTGVETVVRWPEPGVSPDR
jgi:hypothetical protein